MQGYKSNINEVVFFLDVLSAGQNKLPMFHPWGAGSPDFLQATSPSFTRFYKKLHFFKKNLDISDNA
ncbi:MAG: hypothetical protein Q4F35_00850 [Akkermansia sp.]|nr:hypothetical protein [Akkermansia sp.]